MEDTKTLFSFRSAASLLMPVALLATVGGQLAGRAPAAQAQTGTFADPAFRKVWERADLPVAQGKVARSWVWGSAPGLTRMERFDEGVGGQHLVQYFDKARMEINDPGANRNDPYFVTNGLLVVEMLTGQVQIGKNTYLGTDGTSTQPVAGDDMESGPFYSELYTVSSLAPSYSYRPPSPQLPAGTVMQPGYFNGLDLLPSVPARAIPAGQAVVPVKAAAYYNKLNIPDVFWNYMNTQGLVYENGAYRNGLLVDWLSTFGYPVTEPMWIAIGVNGASRLVLFQAFERRTLTYSPMNPDGWKVEMGNVGAQYLKWREESRLYCLKTPLKGLTRVWNAHPEINMGLGCPSSNSQLSNQGVTTAYQPFEHGAMLYASRTVYSSAGGGYVQQQPVYVMFDDGSFEQFQDSWQQGQPESGGLTPPAGKYEPVRGFGKVWREGDGGNIRQRLGWATQPEAGGPGAFVPFQLGEIYWSSVPNKSFVFYGIASGAPYPIPVPGRTGARLRYAIYDDHYQP